LKIASQVYYSFNCGSGPSVVQSESVYNDGDWHTVSFSRKSAMGKLVIDNVEKIEGSSKGNTNTINVQAPFYIGGLNDKMANASKSNLGVRKFGKTTIKNNQICLVSLSFFIPSIFNNIPFLGLEFNSSRAKKSLNSKGAIFWRQASAKSDSS